MKLKLRPLQLVLFVAFTGLPILAQTPRDLERRYGKPDNYFVRRLGYEVRPEIIMTVSFTSDGQACEMVIEPKRVANGGVVADKNIPAPLVNEIISEVAPMAQRGHLINSMILGNYSSFAWEDYERVKISKFVIGVGGPEENLRVEGARIRWKQRQCQ
jgi:hypothetical protein